MEIMETAEERIEERIKAPISSDRLVYYLYRRPLHPELFEIYNSTEISHVNYGALIWITGCSHVITFSSGNRYLSEVIGPESELLPENGLSTRFVFRGEKNHEGRYSNGLRYYMSSNLERMSEAVLVRTYRELWDHGSNRRVFHAFPKDGHPTLAPFALIDYETRQRELHVNAFHCFPGQKAILKSQSIFEISR